jgi:hypothetical protein
VTKDIRSRRASAPSAIAALAALLALMAPALWNRYPLLQYDTGGYLARWYEGYLVPSRSTVFGLYLHLGEGLHFWPIVFAQSAITIWVISLTLRVFSLGRRPVALFAAVAGLSILTGLPWLTSVLLTDIFAGIGVIALHLLVMHANSLGRWERAGLFLLVAFSAATHSATFAMLLALLAAGWIASLATRQLAAFRRLALGTAAVALGALMLISANFALSGKATWTPGGYGIVFGRMLQDGIVKRYLEDHCPDPRLRLCPYQHELPATADEFLWKDGVFNRLGRFNGLGEEMRTIVLESLSAYPVQQLQTAMRATAEQITMVATGEGIHDFVYHTYGIIERFIPSELPAMRAARQQYGELGFDAINRLQVPVAWLSLALMLVLFLQCSLRRVGDLAALVATIILALLANAFICGVLSGPHDRYGARIVWIATFAVGIAAARTFRQQPDSEAADHGAVTAAP